MKWMFPLPDPSSPPPRFTFWQRLLEALVPLVRLVMPEAPAEPVHGIALPDGEPVQEASAISAYYLSFYE